MDAIITAGGVPAEGEPLFPLTNGICKALLPIGGKPMIQWVLNALDLAESIDRVILVGLPDESAIDCKKLAALIPNQGEMLQNIISGVKKTLELNPAAHHVLLVSSDIPGIRSEMVNWVVNTAMQTDEDIYYNVIKQEVIEERYPNSKRSFIHLKDMDICGGDMNVIRTMTVTANDQLWRKIVAARKNVFQQAALIGYDTLILLLLRQLTLDQAVRTVVKRLKITGRILVCPYPEVGMDVDKPHHYEIMNADLLKQASKGFA